MLQKENTVKGFATALFGYDTALSQEDETVIVVSSPVTQASRSWVTRTTCFLYVPHGMLTALKTGAFSGRLSCERVCRR